MFKIFALLCISLYIKSALSSKGILPPQAKPAEYADKEGCYVPELKKVIQSNVTFSPPPAEAGCKQYICQANGFTQIDGCSTVVGASGCRKVDGDLSAPYPGCCPSINCN